MSIYEVYRPGPHYQIYDASGIYPLLVEGDLVLDSHAEAQQHMSEIATEGIDTTGAQIVEVRGGYWLARCSSCGAVADDEDYVYPEWTDVLYVAADVNQTIAELPSYLAHGPEWFADHERQDLRCDRHTEQGYVPVEVTHG